MRYLDRKLETISDALFDEICKSVIRGICLGALLYFAGVIGIWWILR